MELKRGYYHLIAIAIVTVWGLTYISTKVLIQNGLQPQEIFFYRFLIAFLGSWFIVPRTFLANNWKDEVWMLLAGMAGGSVYFYTENTALGITQVSNVAFLLCMAPLFTTFLSILFFREEKLGANLFGGSLLALIGVALVVFSGVSLKINPLGDFLTLGAALSWAIYSVLIRRLSARYSTVFLTRKVFFYGVLSIIPAFFFHPFTPSIGQLLSPSICFNLLFLAVVASLGCFVLWNVVLKKLGIVHTSNYIYLSPLVSLAGSAVLLGERMTPIALLGATCILCGVYWAEKKIH